MIYLFCGVIIGIVMGLTGAGGALIAIPLFMQFLGMDLKLASVYSLVAVILASVSNFISQRHFTQLKISLLVFTFSTLGSLITAPYKKDLPEILISILLVLVSVYALYGVWFKTQSNSTPHLLSTKKIISISIPVGILLGILTTLTGLGGGVLMMPIFMNIYYLEQKQAVASSLLAVCFSSLFSLLVQVYKGANVVIGIEVIYLMVGIIISVWLIKLLASKLTQKQMEMIRKYVFTFVVIFALGKILS